MLMWKNKKKFKERLTIEIHYTLLIFHTCLKNVNDKFFH